MRLGAKVRFRSFGNEGPAAHFLEVERAEGDAQKIALPLNEEQTSVRLGVEEGGDTAGGRLCPFGRGLSCAHYCSDTVVIGRRCEESHVTGTRAYVSLVLLAGHSLEIISAVLRVTFSFVAARAVYITN